MASGEWEWSVANKIAHHSPLTAPRFFKMAKLKLDLHPLYNKGNQIDQELERIIQEAIEKKIELVELIPGKGTGALRKTVKRFLNQKHIRNLYHRLEVDDKNHGRFFVHFRFK